MYKSAYICIYIYIVRTVFLVVSFFTWPCPATKEVPIFLEMSSGSELKHLERVLFKALEEVFNDDKQDDQSEEEHSHSSWHSVDHQKKIYIVKSWK